MKKLKSIIISVFFILILSKFSNAQNYNFFNYNIVDGLPQSQAYAICQDSFGYLWVGTLGGGVAHFDGKKFETDLLPSDLNSDYIYSLYTLPENELLIGTDKGLNLYKKGKIINVSFNDQKYHKINSIAVWKKKIILGADDGLFELYSDLTKAKPIFRENTAFNNRINELRIVDNTLWIASKNGLWFYDNFTNKFKLINGLPFPEVQAIASNNKNEIWIGILGYGVIQFDLLKMKIKDKFTSQSVYKPFTILIDSEEKVWIGTMENGITIIDPITKNLHLLNENNGLSSKNIRKIFSDSWHNIWIGTSGGGLIKKSSLPFKYYNPYEYGVRGKRVYSIANTEVNDLLVSINSGILTDFNDLRFDLIKIDSLNINTKIKSIVSQGTNIWLGTEGQGIICFDSIFRKPFSSKTKVRPGYWVNHLIKDKQNKIWAAIRGEGIYCLKEQSDSIYIINRFSTKNGLTDDNINSLATDKNGNIWFVSKNGTTGYVDVNLKITLFGIKNGIPPNPIKTICFDSLNNLYIGIPGAGIYTTKIQYGNFDLKFSKLKSDNSKFSNSLYSMICDNDNRLWVGSQNGVYKLNIKEDEILEIQHFTKNDGFYGIENCHNAVVIDQLQRIWFGTMNGLMCYNPNENTTNENPPKLHFVNISISGKPLNFLTVKTIDLPYNKNSLIFEFKAIHLRFPEKIVYRFILKGADEKWSEWSQDEKVNLASLSPGKYEFIVQSKLEGNQIISEKRFSFSIIAPFWKKNWFYFLICIISLLILFSISRYREKRIKRKNEKIKKELEIQNKMLMLEQKALQLQMNPHFIFNTLNSIQSLIVESKMEEARMQIQNFAGLMRRILNNSKKKTVSINEEIDAVKKYLEVEKFCQNNVFEFKIDLKSQIDTEEIEIPSMLIQPFVENAVIHGIAHLQKPGRILISIDILKDYIEIKISDNGVGRAKAKELKANKSTDHVSSGIEVTMQRLKSLSKGYNFNPIEIIDLIDNENKPGGTEVILRIPITYNF